MFASHIPIPLSYLILLSDLFISFPLTLSCSVQKQIVLQQPLLNVTACPVWTIVRLHHSHFCVPMGFKHSLEHSFPHFFFPTYPLLTSSLGCVPCIRVETERILGGPGMADTGLRAFLFLETCLSLERRGFISLQSTKK